MCTDYERRPAHSPQCQTGAINKFNEAGELAYYSRRFHPSTLTPAIRKNIPVRILNTYEPTAPGTSINAVKSKKTATTRKAVKTIVYKKDLFLVTITSGRMLMQYGSWKRYSAYLPNIK